MGKIRKKITALFLWLMLLGLLSGCRDGAYQYHPIQDAGDLEGRRVAVNLAWETDYLLTPRKDLKVMRYDSLADMIMALRFNKVDAIAVDGLLWKMIDHVSDGLRLVTPAFGESGYTLYFSPNGEELKNDFNAFLAQYRQSEEYQDQMDRMEAFDGVHYIGPDIELTGTGKVLKVAIDAEAFPRSFQDTNTNQPTGYDLEALKYFANARGYQLEISLSNFEDIAFGLLAGVYDVGTGYLSDVYEYEVENAGLFTSDPLDITGLYFVEKTKQDIRVNMEALE